MSQPFRVLLNFTFNGTLTAGFTERWDFDDGGAGQSYWMNAARGVVAARKNVLSQSWRISDVRIGTLAPKLSAKTGKYFTAFKNVQICPNIPGGNGMLGVGDTPNSAVYVRQKFTGASRTVARQMRGIPDTWWDNAALVNAAGGILSFFQNIKNYPQIEFVTNKTTGSATYNVVNCSDLERISSRRTGRPLLPLRGRRSKKHA